MRKSYLSVVVCVCIVLIFALQGWAQSITSGDVTGVVTDPAGAVVPAASVTLTNINTNVSLKTTTSAEGTYRFAFIQPGTYKVSVSASGFAAQERGGVVVTPGQPTGVDFQLQLSSTTTTVEVTEAVSVVQTENADTSTHYDTQAVLNMPNPGSDLTYIAQTSPGIVMNTQSGYGNFSSNGMPGTSNQFTINGTNFTDPFLSLNNSGASNLMLGSNDIAEVSVINNGYSAQYGQYAGAQAVYITKSGSNQFHGDAVYMWNGRALNANQFFANEAGQPTPFNNYNMWQTGVQGPIRKNKTFFDVDYEGLRNLLPTSANLNLIPSPQFQAATLQNLAGNGNAAEIPFYKQIFAVYNNAPGASTATPVPGGCQGFTSPLLAANAPCALEFRSTPPNTNKEYQWAARVDHNFSDKDRVYVRVWRDNGFQPTYTSPFGAIFNLQSNQPQMSGMVSETHLFGPNTVNQFNGTSWFYAAVFVPSDQSAALAALPTVVGFSGSPFTTIGPDAFPGPGPYFPQGRRVFQYQILDDLSHIRGAHTFRVGFSWLHDTMTDLDFPGGPAYGSTGAIVTTLSDFFNGGGPDTSLAQSFPSSSEEGFRFNTMAGYVADDWKATDRLTISMNLRIESYFNPTCDANCFSRLSTTFTGAPQPNAATTPYNQMILSNLHNAYPNTQTAVVEPRLGIAWRPFHSDKTVIRTGAGVFADEFPGTLAEYAAFNTPGYNAFTISNPTGTIAPGVAGSLFTTAAQANQALLSQFRSGGSLTSISQSVPGFVVPTVYNFPNNLPNPTYYKWNFEIQQALAGKMLLSVNYSGMHGSHLLVQDGGLNAYCPPSVCTSGFVGLPSAPPNAALGTVNQFLSAGTSNYNGLTVSLQRHLSQGFTFNLNYTWSHALDDVSNGGIEPFDFFPFVTNNSILLPQNPFNIRGNYGNADYDIRHYVSATVLLTDALRHAGFHWGPNRVFGGWTLSSNWFFRTGLPFTIIDNSAFDTLLGYNYDGANPTSGAIFASPVTKVPSTCTNAVNSPCLSPSEFAPAANGVPTGFGTIGRNSVYGPHFFDVDLALMKDVAITERVTFSFGAQAYNVFNHPNFDQPVNDISNPNFGLSTNVVGPPTSILGSFVGAGASPRFLEIKGLVRF